MTCRILIVVFLACQPLRSDSAEGAGLLQGGQSQTKQSSRGQDSDSVPVQPLKWKVSQPSPDKESMLSRFVEECVRISPGELRVKRTAADSVLSPNLVIRNEYRICRFETTQELYQLVMGVNPSRWRGPRNSVEQVTYSDAVRFCEKLTAVLRSRQLIGKGEIVRLPTDNEWEFACRAGAKTKYCFGELAETTDGRSLLDDYAWHAGNAAGNDPSVGILKPNRWQLADVHGYLWEFTQIAKSAKTGSDLKIRVWGGSWTAKPVNCGCSSMQEVEITRRSPDLGFRCVISQKVTLKNTAKQ